MHYPVPPYTLVSLYNLALFSVILQCTIPLGAHVQRFGLAGEGWLGDRRPQRGWSVG